MYVIIAPIQIKPGFKEKFIEEMIGDARGSVNNEPGCLRFDVIQDAEDPNRIWLYEVYKDEAAFQEHTKSPTWSSGGTPSGTGDTRASFRVRDAARTTSGLLTTSGSSLRRKYARLTLRE